jgi:hypothetical protein
MHMQNWARPTTVGDAEFGSTGEFWTPSSETCRLVLFPPECREAVSTDDAGSS